MIALISFTESRIDRILFAFIKIEITTISKLNPKKAIMLIKHNPARDLISISAP